jgi:hypothetical protein
MVWELNLEFDALKKPRKEILYEVNNFNYQPIKNFLGWS